MCTFIFVCFLAVSIKIANSIIVEILFIMFVIVVPAYTRVQDHKYFKNAEEAQRIKQEHISRGPKVGGLKTFLRTSAIENKVLKDEQETGR